MTAHKDEVEEVGAKAQEILDESHVNSRMGCQATQLTSRYQALLLQVLVRMDHPVMHPNVLLPISLQCRSVVIDPQRPRPALSLMAPFSLFFHRNKSNSWKKRFRVWKNQNYLSVPILIGIALLIKILRMWLPKLRK